MSSFIRAALQGNTSDNTTIIMDGPLSEQFTKALNIAFAKKDPVTGEVMDGATPDDKNAGTDKQIRALTVESQQLDEHALAGAISLNKSMAAPSRDELRVYAVDEAAVETDDIVRFARIAVNVKIPSSLVLIAQKAQEQSIDNDNEHINQALQVTDKVKETSMKAATLLTLAQSFNVKTYPSLQDFKNEYFD